MQRRKGKFDKFFSDSFTFKVNDGEVDSDLATLTAMYERDLRRTAERLASIVTLSHGKCGSADEQGWLERVRDELDSSREWARCDKIATPCRRG